MSHLAKLRPPTNHENCDVHETITNRSPAFDTQCILHRSERGTTLVYIKTLMFWSLTFFDKLSKKCQKNVMIIFLHARFEQICKKSIPFCCDEWILRVRELSVRVPRGPYAIRDPYVWRLAQKCEGFLTILEFAQIALSIMGAKWSETIVCAAAINYMAGTMKFHSNQWNYMVCMIIMSIDKEFGT